MKFLVIAQDLRISGTSEGIVSRSFIQKLRNVHPNAIIDVLYLKSHENNDQLDLLPVDSIEKKVILHKVPDIIRFVNKFYWRLFHTSLYERYINKQYAAHIKKVIPENYDHVFVRSSGLDFEAILALKGFPILKKAIINFHDPYPLFWYPGTKTAVNGRELFKVKSMLEIVSAAKCCISPAELLSNDMEFLYGSKKKYYTLPHQYDAGVFDFTDTSNIRKKNKKVAISYHGVLMFGRNIDILLDAYKVLIEKNPTYKNETEFVLRLRGAENKRLREKYSTVENIVILDGLNFSNSAYEQQNESDIIIILENGPIYSNTLVGKAPFVAQLHKPILCISPERSELRKIVNNRYIASSNDADEVQSKLEMLLIDRLQSDEPVDPFGDYFGDENFKRQLDTILFSNG